MSRKLLEGFGSDKDDDSDDDSDMDETFLQNKDEDFQPIPGEPGLYYKVRDLAHTSSFSYIGFMILNRKQLKFSCNKL